MAPPMSLFGFQVALRVAKLHDVIAVLLGSAEVRLVVGRFEIHVAVDLVEDCNQPVDGVECGVRRILKLCAQHKLMLQDEAVGGRFRSSAERKDISQGPAPLHRRHGREPATREATPTQFHASSRDHPGRIHHRPPTEGLGRAT